MLPCLRWILGLGMNVLYQGRGIWGVNFPGSNHLIKLLSVTPSPVISLTQSFTLLWRMQLPGCLHDKQPGIVWVLGKVLGVNWSSWSCCFPMFTGRLAEEQSFYGQLQSRLHHVF